MSGTGAVIITQKNGRKTSNTGTIYLRDGLIYAASIENYKVPIGKRIETGALAQAEDLKEVFNKVSGDTTSPRIIDHLLQNHMLGEKILSSYVKEHFIEILGRIMSWNDTLGEWHPNAVTKDFVMPFVTFDRIREILAHRKHVYGEFLRFTEKFMRPEELPELTFSLLKSSTTAQSPTSLKIISLCDGKNTIDDIAKATGVTFYNVFQTIVGLWKEELIALNIGGIRLPYASVVAQPEIEYVPVPVELTNPPIPVHEEADEESETPVDEEIIDADKQDDVVIIDPHGEGTPSILAEYAEEHGHTFHHYQASVENDTALYDPLAARDDEESDIIEDYNPDLVESNDHKAATEPVVEPSDNPVVAIIDEVPEVNNDSLTKETSYGIPKDILDRRNKVEEISNKLNQLESNLVSCEDDLRDNQIELEALEERKSQLERELGDVAADYQRTIAESNKIKESYELIRKEVEDTINSFTFVEGE